jgi:hypothetical protein
VKIMELLATWRSSYTLRFVPIALMQVIFSAGTVFTLAALLPSTKSMSGILTTTNSRPQAILCVQYLNEISRSWNCANSIREILEYWLQRSEGVSQQTSEPNQQDVTSALSAPSATAIPGRTVIDSSSFEDYLHPRSAPDQSSPFSVPLDPGLNFEFDFGGQPYNIDQFMDVFVGDSSYGTDSMGAALGGPGLPISRSWMPDDHIAADRSADHPLMPFGLGADNPPLLDVSGLLQS